ncbi:MAG: hypothetical protein FWG71_00435 [Synergistaceae bacterium]|nr:hypothetical protein [Synergistaceae bacterium]
MRVNKHGRQDAAPTQFRGNQTMKELPKRKPNRLKDYDYSQNGAYFVTICALGRMEIFSAITVGAASCRPFPQDHPSPLYCPRLTHTGEIIENEILTLSRTYEDVSVDCSVIMPNHVHMIIGIYGNGRQNAAPTVSRVMNQWKRAVSIKVGYSVWQKSFHDHIIRDEDDYRRIAEYIENNPQTWTEDCFYRDVDSFMKFEEIAPQKICSGAAF